MTEDDDGYLAYVERSDDQEVRELLGYEEEPLEGAGVIVWMFFLGLTTVIGVLAYIIYKLGG